MAPPKRKNVYRDEYAKEFQGIKRGKTEEHAHCIPCQFDIALTATGKHAITHHQQSDKHKKAAKAVQTTKAIASFMPSTSAPTNLDRQTAACEGVWAYHIARHGQSFASADCLSSLLPKSCPDSKIAAKFSSRRHKTAAIITGVLAPHSIQKALEELNGRPFSISIDSSNHKTTKLFPLVVRYFSKKGVQVKLLDLEELGGETSAEVYEWIIGILKKHQLETDQLVAFCGDNVNANFGGAEHAGERNIFSKLKTHKGNLVPVGCPAHILHNSCRHASDNLPYDIEAIVFKLSSHFKISKQRYQTQFYGMITNQLLRHLPAEESTKLRESFQLFLKETVQYVNKWFRIERFPTNVDWISLKDKGIQHQQVMDLAEQIAPELDDNQLFDEVSTLQEILEKIPDEKFEAMSAEQKWKIFEAKLPTLDILVSKVMSIPVTNACVERVFSLCSAQWTDTRNSLKVETVKCLAQIKQNYDLDCSEMYDVLISSPQLLKQIIGGLKYDI